MTIKLADKGRKFNILRMLKLRKQSNIHWTSTSTTTTSTQWKVKTEPIKFPKAEKIAFFRLFRFVVRTCFVQWWLHERDFWFMWVIPRLCDAVGMKKKKLRRFCLHKERKTNKKFSEKLAQLWVMLFSTSSGDASISWNPNGAQHTSILHSMKTPLSRESFVCRLQQQKSYKRERKLSYCQITLGDL